MLPQKNDLEARNICQQSSTIRTPKVHGRCCRDVPRASPYTQTIFHPAYIVPAGCLKVLLRGTSTEGGRLLTSTDQH
eukprot:1150138-Pelagomonas_calceolata.AAC.7